MSDILQVAISVGFVALAVCAVPGFCFIFLRLLRRFDD